MSTLWMLIGVSGSGKSTWIKQQGFDNSVFIASTDQFVEDYAASQGMTPIARCFQVISLKQPLA